LWSFAWDRIGTLTPTLGGCGPVHGSTVFAMAARWKIGSEISSDLTKWGFHTRTY